MCCSIPVTHESQLLQPTEQITGKSKEAVNCQKEATKPPQTTDSIKIAGPGGMHTLGLSSTCGISINTLFRPPLCLSLLLSLC